MSNKTFIQAPKPKPPSADIIAAFEQRGAGHDSQRPIPSNVGKLETTKTVKAEPLRRLSVDLPESLHRRFKLACIKGDKSMQTEVADFIERRTKQLEGQG